MNKYQHIHIHILHIHIHIHTHIIHIVMHYITIIIGKINNACKLITMWIDKLHIKIQINYENMHR